jgi:plastocyanin
MSKRALAALMAAFLLPGCAAERKPSGNVSSGPATSSAVKIEMGDNLFKPTALSLKTGDLVTVEVTNKGNRPHDFTIDSLNLGTGLIEPGKVATATFRVPKQGTEFVCTLHRGMSGKIVA